MKPSTLRILLKGFKITAFVTIIGFAGIFLMAMKARQKANDIWKQLGIAQAQANMNINNSFVYGDFYYGGAKLAKNIAKGDRVAVVKQLVTYARQHANSKEFKTAYQDFRKRKLPKPPVEPKIDAEALKAMEKQRLERNLKTAEAGLNSTNPKIKNSAPSRIEKIKKEIAALEDPANPVIKKKVDDAARSYQHGMKLYEDKLKKFEEEFPEDPNGMLKIRLQQMLDITADVDYNAELKEVNKKMKFVNPVYEKKPAGWKLAFRAGKETTDAVRAEAEKWLRELNSF